MNHSHLITRAWRITWRYKVLWLFGILLALTGSGGGGSGGGGGGGNITLPGTSDRVPQIPSLEGFLDRFDPSLFAGIAFLCCCLLLIWVIAATILRYVARTALYRSVDLIESSDSAPTWREGFRLGWNTRAFRIWLLDLIVGIPFVIAVILLLTLGASPLLLLLIDSPLARGIGIALTVGLELLVIGVLILAAIALSVLSEFWSREIAIGGRDIGQAFTSGYRMVRARLGDVGVMWLLMLAIGLGFALVMIPVVLLVLALAAGIGGGLGYGIYHLTDSIPWAVAVGMPLFLLLTIIPATFVQGLYETFKASAWTLAYREVAGTAAVG